MRITNQMTTNKFLLNINRNARIVDNFYSQLTTGKKIQFPSDNPIIASRALKFRTNVSQTEQYQRNTSQGLSWMEVTEQGFKNTLSILESFRERLVQGASDTFTYADRDKIVTEMQALMDQIGSEMNVSYTGRYVFSGYRTNLPPIIQNDDPRAKYTITQVFSQSDIFGAKGYEKVSPDDAPDIKDVYKLNLPYYGDATDGTGNKVDIDGAVLSTYDSAGAVINSYTITAVSKNDLNAYDPDAASSDIHYIKETGELIIGATAMAAIKTDNPAKLETSYDIEGLYGGDLNPVVYFSCTDNNTGKSYDMENQILKFEFSTSTAIQVNSLAKDSYTASLYADFKRFLDVISNVQITSAEELRLKYDDGSRTPEEVEEAVRSQITEETKKYTDFMHNNFTVMLERFEVHNATSLREYTTLGARMNRLELIESRLEQDVVSYTKLMSENEDVDYLEVIMKLNAANSVYSASMQSGARISQLTLADYMR